MLLTDRLEVLRQRNKDLLAQLSQQREKLERPCGCGHQREEEDEEKQQPKDVLTLTNGDRGPARAALAASSVTSAEKRQTQCQGTVSTQSSTSKHTGVMSEHASSHSDKDVQLSSGQQDSRSSDTKSCLVNHRKQQKREVQNHVTFQADECEEVAASDGHHLQPLLGYDWIAGVLDVEDSMIERTDDFFNDLRLFRSLNKDECEHSSQAEFSEENHSVLPLLTDRSGPETKMDTHQCTFSYRINSRLFPVPLHYQECCPVCKKHKSSQPHTIDEPVLIRVSIPCSTLLPPYKYKAHRRCSFDPSDSLGLPSHCLSGWSNTGQSSRPPPGSLDLRSSLDMKDHNKELEDLSALEGSRNHQAEQIPDVPRLARHSFLHFSPKRKPRCPRYPVC
ncbi:migration and invasion inhibitory protein [Aulostomus maculatus]